MRKNIKTVDQVDGDENPTPATGRDHQELHCKGGKSLEGKGDADGDESIINEDEDEVQGVVNEMDYQDNETGVDDEIVENDGLEENISMICDIDYISGSLLDCLPSCVDVDNCKQFLSAMMEVLGEKNSKTWGNLVLDQGQKEKEKVVEKVKKQDAPGRTDKPTWFKIMSKFVKGKPQAPSKTMNSYFSGSMARGGEKSPIFQRKLSVFIAKLYFAKEGYCKTTADFKEDVGDTIYNWAKEGWRLCPNYKFMLSLPNSLKCRKFFPLAIAETDNGQIHMLEFAPVEKEAYAKGTRYLKELEIAEIEDSELESYDAKITRREVAIQGHRVGIEQHQEAIEDLKRKIEVAEGEIVSFRKQMERDENNSCLIANLRAVVGVADEQKFRATSQILVEASKIILEKINSEGIDASNEEHHVVIRRKLSKWFSMKRKNSNEIESSSSPKKSKQDERLVAGVSVSGDNDDHVTPLAPGSAPETSALAPQPPPEPAPEVEPQTTPTPGPTTSDSAAAPSMSKSAQAPTTGSGDGEDEQKSSTVSVELGPEETVESEVEVETSEPTGPGAVLVGGLTTVPMFNKSGKAVLPQNEMMHGTRRQVMMKKLAESKKK